MSGSVPAVPTIADIQAVMRSGDQRAQQAALAIKPPDKVDPQDVEMVMKTVRAAEAAKRGGIDIAV